MSERSVALYEGLLWLHIVPRLGLVGLRKITPAPVRTWRQELLDGGVGPSTVSKAYRLLRAVLNTASDDELIRRNPCRIKGAGVEHPAERPVLTLTQVMTLADSIDPRYRLLVLLAVFASLRWGELVGLRKTDSDLAVGLVHVRRSMSLVGAKQIVETPKTAAGLRTVALPMWLIPGWRSTSSTTPSCCQTDGCSSAHRVSLPHGPTSRRSGHGLSTRLG